MTFPSPAKVEHMRQRYHGKRVELIKMNDPHDPVPPGTKGTVRYVDGAGTLQMQWDNGRTLGLMEGEDEFKLITNDE